MIRLNAASRTVSIRMDSSCVLPIIGHRRGPAQWKGVCLLHKNGAADGNDGNDGRPLLQGNPFSSSATSIPESGATFAETVSDPEQLLVSESPVTASTHAPS